MNSQREIDRLFELAERAVIALEALAIAITRAVNPRVFDVDPEHPERFEAPSTAAPTSTAAPER